MVKQPTLTAILEDRRTLESLLAKDPTNLKGHQLLEKLRSFLTPDPDFNQELKRLEMGEEANMCLADRPHDFSPRACGADWSETMPILCGKPWTGSLVLMNGNVLFCCHMMLNVGCGHDTRQERMSR